MASVVISMCIVKSVLGVGYERSHLDAAEAFPLQFVDALQHEEPSVNNARTDRSIVVEKGTTWCPVLAGRPSEWNLQFVRDCRILQECQQIEAFALLAASTSLQVCILRPELHWGTRQ